MITLGFFALILVLAAVLELIFSPSLDVTDRD